MMFLKRHFYPSAIIFGLFALVIFLGSTDPEQINVGLLVVPVILVFLITFCVAQVVFDALKLMKKQPRRRRVVSMVSAAITTTTAILLTTGGLSGVDVLLLALIVLISSIYINKF